MTPDEAALLEQAPDAIFVADLEGRYTYVNEAGCRLLGRTRAEILGRAIFDLIPEEDVERLLASKDEMAHGRPHVGKWRLLHSSGAWVPVEVHANILPDGRWQGFVRDLTSRRQADAQRERLLRQIDAERTLLQAVIELLPVGLWITDPEGRITTGNPAGQRIWAGARYVGVPEYAQYQGWWLDSGKPIGAEEWAAARAVKGEASIGELVRIRCFDGSFKVIVNSAAPIRNAAGVILGAIIVNEDITSLYEAQEKLRASEQTFRTVFELLPVGLWVADREGRIAMANPAGLRIWAGTQYVGPEEYGKYRAWWAETGAPIAPDDWGLARAIGRGETSQGELLRIQCFDGSLKTVVNFAAPIRGASGEITGAVAVNEDVTTLYQTQEQLRAAVRDREQILALVTHDLRNPLSGLSMWASALRHELRELPGGERIVPLVESLLDTTRRMSGMVDDLLAVAVAQRGQSMLRRSRVPAAALLEQAVRAARPKLARQGLALEVPPAPALPAIDIDRDRILRVLDNLVDNACKFTSAPGSVTLSAQPVSGGVRFCVANTGPALAPEQLASLFEPFWQAAREDRRGAGLGLSICRSIIEAHGGTIWAEPAAGQRVRICFDLPRVASGEPAAALEQPDDL